MIVSTLTFISSDKEISSGIPESVSIESNIPSTIHFTLNGSMPTIDSPIYIFGIDLPTGRNSITLRAFGVDSNNTAGPILTQTFAPDTTKITVSRNISPEGIIANRADLDIDIPTGFDAEGAPARFVDIDPALLDIIHSDRGFEGINPGTQIVVNIPDPNTTPYPYDDNFHPFSTPEFAGSFNPYAMMIVIDNRLNNEIKLMPRAYGSSSNIYREFGGKRLRESPDNSTYVSGGFVKRFYNSRNNVMVSYYFDHSERRYVKNIQELPNNIPNTSIGGSTSTMPLVFKWLGRDGRQAGNR